jgi:type I restriction enzyme S subunit
VIDLKELQEYALHIAMGPFGSSIKKSTFVDEGIPIISGQHLHGAKLDEKGGFNFITREHANKHSNSIVQRGDVVFTAYGTIGQVSFVPEDSHYDEYIASQRQFFLRPDPSKLDGKYLTYYFHSPSGRHLLLSNSSQVGVPSIASPTSFLRELTFPIPSLKDQKAIAQILGTLDDKIELNQKMNQTLEEIAKAIFKSWFVDFDPVRAKAEGRPTGLPPEISDLFPDELVDSEIGEIPKGWSVLTLGEIVTPKKGKSITKKKVVEGSVPVVAGGLSPAYYHNTSNVKAPTVTISASGANAGFARLYNEDIWASDCSYISEEQTPFVFLWYVFLKIHQEKIYHMQQGAAQPHIYPSDLMRLQLAYPESDKLWRHALDLIAPMFLRIGNADKESVVLSEFRDTLLPKLISGELRIPDAEKFLEEAGI